MSLTDGIVELRQKGAPLRLVWEVLATVDVAVGTDTIARLPTEVNRHDVLQQVRRQSSHRREAVRNPTAAQTAAAPVITEPLPSAQSPVPLIAHRSASRPIRQSVVRNNHVLSLTKE